MHGRLFQPWRTHVSLASSSSKHFEQEKEDTTKMQRCGSSYCNPVGPCSCYNNDHLYHHHHTTTTTQANSFSMLFSMPNHHQYHNHKNTFDAYHDHPMIMTTSPSSSSSSSVDCTLSLSTPSSTNAHHHHRKSNISSKLCGWNIFQSTSSNKHKKPPTITTAAAANNKLNSRGGGNSDSGLTSRRCANCDTTSTPLWRNGPKGPKSLCNACGIRYKKEERRATNTTNGSEVASAMSMEPQEQQQHYSWTTQHSQQTHMMPSTCPVTEFRFIEDDDRQYSPYMNSSNSTSTGGSAANVPFLSWRLNVPERPSSLVHDYI